MRLLFQCINQYSVFLYTQKNEPQGNYTIEIITTRDVTTYLLHFDKHGMNLMISAITKINLTSGREDFLTFPNIIATGKLRYLPQFQKTHSCSCAQIFMVLVKTETYFLKIEAVFIEALFFTKH